MPPKSDLKSLRAELGCRSPRGQASDHLTHRPADALDAMPIARTAQEHRRANLRHDLREEFVDFLLALLRRRAPVIPMRRAYPFAVAAQNAVQERAEIIVLKLVDLAFPQRKSVFRKMTERTRAERFEPRCAPGDAAVRRKEPHCDRRGNLRLAQMRKEPADHETQGRAHLFIIPHPVVNVPPQGTHVAALLLPEQRTRERRERGTLRCEYERILPFHGRQRDG